MGETLSEYMHMIASTIIFASAITLLITILNQLSDFNRSQMEIKDSKTTISLASIDPNDELLISGDNVFTDIMSSSLPGSSIRILSILGGPVYCNNLELAKLGETSEIANIQSKINYSSDYKVMYEYNDKHEIIAVTYTEQ